ADRGAPPRSLIAFSKSIWQAVMSPDRRYAVITVNDPTSHAATSRAHLYVVDLNGDRQPKALDDSEAWEAGPAISPDGRWLAYASDETGRKEVYVRRFPAGATRLQVSSDGGTDPRWGSDSRDIVYRNADRFMRAHLAPVTDTYVTRRDSLFSFF